MDFNTNYMRNYLLDVASKISLAAETLGWAEGEPVLVSTELVPGFKTDSEGEAAYKRYIKRIQSIGPRALSIKRSGAIGEVNWGGDQGELDKKLEDIDLKPLAQKALKNLFCMGAAAGWAYKSKLSKKETLQLLGGFVLPIYYEGEEGGEVIGIYQCIKGDTARVTYTIRIYDFETREIKEWRNRVDPTEIFSPPQDTFPNQPMPRIVLYDVNQTGWPISELQNALPILKEEVSNQLSIMRNTESHIFAILALLGKFEDIKKLGPNRIITSMEPGAKVERIEGANFDSLFTLHDRTLERIRQDLALPAGFNGADIPSGEALKEANTHYLSSIKEYAGLISSLLTDMVQDFALLVKAKPVPVNVDINREAEREIISNQARADYQAGIIDLRAATIAISAYYPNWSNDELEAFLAREEMQQNADPAANADVTL